MRVQASDEFRKTRHDDKGGELLPLRMSGSPGFQIRLRPKSMRRAWHVTGSKTMFSSLTSRWQTSIA